MDGRWCWVLGALVFTCTSSACRETTSEGGPTFGIKQQAVLTDCVYLDPNQVAPLADPVDYERELVITDLSVVEDPCRTTWTAGGCPSSQLGVWTFGYLMSEMAGNRSPGQFIAEWLHSYENGGVVSSGFSASPRPDIAPLIMAWKEQSGCAGDQSMTGDDACDLDIRLAPFRLLAIVNRLDLQGRAYAEESNGEGRFVFGFLDHDGNPLQATVIFEYHLDAGQDIFEWASQWHQLSSLPLGTSTFNDTLQDVTDRFTKRWLSSGAPNHESSIGQVRTNEVVFGPDWVLREFTLQDDGSGDPDAFLLLPDTVKQNPDDSLNGSSTLDTFLVDHEPEILMLEHEVPHHMLAGETFANFVWTHSNPSAIQAETRHLFAFSTCGGCHLDETATGFLHIEPRPAGVASNLSAFLNQTTAWSGSDGWPAGSLNFSAPFGFSVEYNEPWRRVCEVTRILNGDPTPYTRGNGAH